MLQSHKILFNQAMQKLQTIKSLHSVVSGQALLPGNEKYKDWASASDELERNMEHALTLLCTIQCEVNNPH